MGYYELVAPTLYVVFAFLSLTRENAVICLFTFNFSDGRKRKRIIILKVINKLQRKH